MAEETVLEPGCVPSGAFKFDVRKGSWKDERLAHPDGTEPVLKWENQSTRYFDGRKTPDEITREIWAVTMEIVVREGESYVPLSVEKEGRYYKKLAFGEWLDEQDPDDVYALHNAVLEKNVKW